LLKWLRAEQIDGPRAPSQSARSKWLPLPTIHRLPGRSKEVAGDDEPQPNRLRFLFKPRCDVNLTSPIGEVKKT